MTFSMTGQGKGDLLIQVTAWTGLTVLQSWLQRDKTILFQLVFSLYMYFEIEFWRSGYYFLIYSGSTILADVYSKQIFPNLTINFWIIFWNTSNIFLFFYPNCRTQEYDNQCCYDDSGILMNPQTLLGSGYANRYHYAGDNLDNIPFLSNFIYDILPYQHCCVYPLQDVDTNVTGCNVFYARRPPNSCLNYVPPVVGKLWRKSSNSDVEKARTPISELKVVDLGYPKIFPSFNFF
jgi:hypothetical protein